MVSIRTHTTVQAVSAKAILLSKKVGLKFGKKIKIKTLTLRENLLYSLNKQCLGSDSNNAHFTTYHPSNDLSYEGSECTTFKM